APHLTSPPPPPPRRSSDLLGERFIPGKPRRAWLAIMAGLVYSFIFLYSFPEWGLGHIIRTADYRPQSMLVFAAFSWWFVGSLSRSEEHTSELQSLRHVVCR